MRLHAPRRTREEVKRDNDAGIKIEPTITVQTALTIIGRRNVALGVSPDKKNKVQIDLSSTSLRRANFQGAILKGANLDGADLTGADLTEANFQGATFCGTNLEEAFLTQADFFKADLQHTCLTGADLTKADLTGADLEESNITQEQFDSAITDKDTIPPEGIINPEASTEPPA